MAAMTPITLIIVSCLIQCIISCIGSMFCPPKTEDNKNSNCMSVSLANSLNSIITIVVILMLANVIPMPGSKSVAAAAMETTE